MTFGDLASINYGWSKESCIDIHFQDEDDKVFSHYNLIPLFRALREYADREVSCFIDDLVMLL